MPNATLNRSIFMGLVDFEDIRYLADWFLIHPEIDLLLADMAISHNEPEEAIPTQNHRRAKSDDF